MTKTTFDRVGGYDERFAGLYGTDGEFRERIVALAGPPVMLKEHIIRVPRDTIPDASTSTYGRKEEQDKGLKDLRLRRNITPGWQPQRLRFPWTRVA